MTIGLAPASAKRRSACSRWASDCSSISRKSPPVSSAQRCGAVEGGLVEGFVELAAEVEDQGRFGQRRTGAEREGGGGAEEFRHEGHRVSPRFSYSGRAREVPRPHTVSGSWSIRAIVRPRHGVRVNRFLARMPAADRALTAGQRARRISASAAVPSGAAVVAGPRWPRLRTRPAVERERRGVVRGDLQEGVRDARRRQLASQARRAGAADALAPGVGSTAKGQQFGFGRDELRAGRSPWVAPEEAGGRQRLVGDEIRRAPGRCRESSACRSRQHRQASSRMAGGASRGGAASAAGGRAGQGGGPSDRGVAASAGDAPRRRERGAGHRADRAARPRRAASAWRRQQARGSIGPSALHVRPCHAARATGQRRPRRPKPPAHRSRTRRSPGCPAPAPARARRRRRCGCR